MAETSPASVLDASALMAVLHAEDGASVVIEAIGEGAAVSVVNWAEVLSKLAEAGKDPEVAAAELRRAEGSRRALSIEPLTAADCVAVARLRPVTRRQGLSLADRACLALAERLDVPALTADREWLTADVAAEVQLIR
ncbi:MAG TPA: type II toxin-antitoxin system VapC family toxin [Solirubrobacterales bacterium]|nr:type II toxin-antitoxin system VapC family toxin [Solirubrobacterales bacterium]